MRVRLAVLLVGILLAMPGRAGAQNTSEPGRELLQSCLDHLFGKGTGLTSASVTYHVSLLADGAPDRLTTLDMKGLELQALRSPGLTLTLSSQGTLMRTLSENRTTDVHPSYREGLSSILSLNPAWILCRILAFREGYVYRLEPGNEASFVRSGFQGLGPHGISPEARWEERAVVDLDGRTLLEYRNRTWGVDGMLLKDVWVLYRQSDPDSPAKWEVVQSFGTSSQKPVHYLVEVSR